MARSGNRQSSIYLGKDGHWHGRVTVGRKEDGSPDRRHVMSKSKGTVVAKVRALERLRDEARVPKAGQGLDGREVVASLARGDRPAGHSGLELPGLPNRGHQASAAGNRPGTS